MKYLPNYEDYKPGDYIFDFGNLCIVISPEEYQRETNSKLRQSLDFKELPIRALETKLITHIRIHSNTEKNPSNPTIYTIQEAQEALKRKIKHNVSLLNELRNLEKVA